MAEYTPTHGKHIRVFTSPNLDELVDLSNYSDPLDLRDNLLNFQYKFTGAEETGMEISLSIMNPTLAFEDKIMKYYNILFNENKKKDIPQNTLTFYFRWGYGTKVEEGLSQIVTATLTGILYTKTDENETVVKLSFVDNLTFSLKKFGTRSDVNVASVAEVDAITDKGVFRKASDIIGDLLGSYSQLFEGVTPVVILNKDTSYADSINKALDAVITYAAGGRLESDAARKAEEKATGEKIEFKFELLPSYNESKIGGDVNPLHKLVGYDIFFKKLGANFTTGYLSGSVESKETVTVKERPQAGISDAAYQSIDPPYYPKYKLSDQLVDDDLLVTYSFTDGAWTYENLQNVIGSEYEQYLPLGFVKNGELYYDVSFAQTILGLTNMRDGSSPISFEGKEEFNKNPILGNVTAAALTGILNKQYAFWANRSKGVLIILNSFDILSLDRKINETNVFINKDKSHSKAEDSTLTEISKETDKVNSVSIVTGFYAKVSLSKMIQQSAYLQLKAFIQKINEFLLPYGDINNYLTIINIDKESLTTKQKGVLAGYLKQDLTSNYYFIITTTGSLRSMFGNDAPDEQEQTIYSFRDLQDKDVFTLSLGFADSIIQEFNFSQDIIPALPNTAISMNTLRTFDELTNNKTPIQITQTIIQELRESTRNTYALAEINNLESEAKSESFSDFVDYFVAFMHGVKQGGYDDETRVMVLDNPKIKAFLISLESDEFFDLFYTGSRTPHYFYDTEGGNIIVKQGSYVYSDIVLNTSFMGEAYDDKGDLVNANNLRTLLMNYLYREGRFTLRVKTKGVPEFSNPLLDLGTRGVRYIDLKIADTRRGSTNLHWLSGPYFILGYTHTINDNGYSTEFDIIRNPFLKKQGMFSA